MKKIELNKDKLFYSIGEVAKMFNVNTSLIRFWEKEFKQIAPRKTESGNRKFTPKDVRNIEKIYHLVKIQGFTLQGAKEHLKIKKTSNPNISEIELKLQHIKTTLAHLLDE